MVKSNAARGDEDQMVGLACDPRIRDLDPCRFKTPQRARRDLFGLPVRAVHLHLGDPERRRTARPHPNRDSLLAERSSLDHKVFDRRHIAREPIERAQGKESADEEGPAARAGQA
jgi:hypothetical protein